MAQHVPGPKLGPMRLDTNWTRLRTNSLIRSFITTIPHPMNELPMPSDLKRDADASAVDANSDAPLADPPGAKLIIRLFLIPFAIVALAVGVMYLISLMAGREPTFDEAIAGLKSAGGGRTADMLVGPGSKQRYIYAKALTNKMKLGMSSAERVNLSDQLIDILDRHTTANEGEIQHVLLLALGRTWQLDPTKPQPDTPDLISARQRAAEALLRYASAQELSTRKAALLAMVYFKGRDDSVRQFVPVLVATVKNDQADLDLRMAAATALGPLGNSSDGEIVDALRSALRDTDPHDAELVWQAALSLAQLNQPDVADNILKLLDRNELSSLQFFDRENDAKNPVFRKLSEAEIERILINTMIGAENYPNDAVQAQLKKLSQTDPSHRVRAALQPRAPQMNSDK
ncbi:hypothetical protein BH09PLA1_BH09PLA1_28720 [soil metagenome]